MKCEILTAFSGIMGSFSVGTTADVPDEHVPELQKLGWIKPLGKATTRKATKKKAETPAGDDDD